MKTTHMITIDFSEIILDSILKFEIQIVCFFRSLNESTSRHGLMKVSSNIMILRYI